MTSNSTENPHKNITIHEKNTLHLKNNDNIIIKKADKGAAVVIMSKEDYIKEGIRQLSDQNLYIKLDHDLTTDHINEIHNTLLKTLQRDEITKKIFDYLVPTGCTTPAWYFLPKIHKFTLKQEGHEEQVEFRYLFIIYRAIMHTSPS